MPKKTQDKAKADVGQAQRATWSLIWAAAAAIWLLLVAALVSYDPADWPNHAVAEHHVQPFNWCGRIGAMVAYQAYHMLGPGVWLMIAGAAAWLVVAARGKTLNQWLLRTIGVIMMAIATSSVLNLMLPQGMAGLLPGDLMNTPERGGGLLAIFIVSELTLRFNHLGTLIILVAAFWVGALLAVDELVLLLPRALARAVSSLAKLPRPNLATAFGNGGAAIADPDTQEKDSIIRRGRRAKVVPADEPIDEDAGGLGATESFDPDAADASRSRRKNKRAAEDDEKELQEPVAKGKPDSDEQGQEQDDDAEVEAQADDEGDTDEDVEAGEEGETGDEAHDAPGAYVAEKKQLDSAALQEKFKAFKINFAATNKPSAAPAPREIDLSGYQFPSLDLLEEPEHSFTTEMEQIVRDHAALLESALQQYRIDGEVVGIDSGPVITLYEVRLAPGTKVSQLNNISSDLARALKAPNIRIVPNMAGKDTVGIEVPNLKKEKVRLKELMTVNADQVAKMKLPMFLGKDASGNPLVQDLASMPHMLIAGTTGSGKSVCMNSIIMSFMYTKRPDELKLVLVDPKMVEMSQFRDIPHLMCPVVTEMAKAAAILEWATTKMDERYELLAEAGVRDVNGYNSLTPEELKERFNPANEEEEARIPKKLPYLVFVIDELADLMMTNKEVEGFIVRLAQKSRAVGMHLILATQRPQANVVTGLIKSNMPCRVSFKVASGMDSRIVLDQKGAEVLLGQGDMLFLSPRTSKLIRAQGTLVDDAEIRKGVKFLKTVAMQNFEPQLVQIKAANADVDEETVRDPLFDDAVRVVLQSKRGSVSLLQRRLTIGYSRASRLIEAMAASGILGDYKGSQAREVNITIEEYEALKAQWDANAAQSEAKGTIFEESGEQADADEAIDEDVEEEDEGVPDEMDGEYRR
jgi:S-DNA-T family DNA segregation ATPase FtsK/SpoIIIE